MAWAESLNLPSGGAADHVTICAFNLHWFSLSIATSAASTILPFCWKNQWHWQGAHVKALVVDRKILRKKHLFLKTSEQCAVCAGHRPIGFLGQVSFTGTLYISACIIWSRALETASAVSDLFEIWWRLKHQGQISSEATACKAESFGHRESGNRTRS